MYAIATHTLITIEYDNLAFVKISHEIYTIIFRSTKLLVIPLQ